MTTVEQPEVVATTSTPEVTLSRRPLTRSLGWFAILALIVIGFGFVASRSAPVSHTGPLSTEVESARKGIEALLAPGTSATPVLTNLPADFTAVTGAIAGIRQAPDGTERAVHVGGGCSTPWGDDNTKWDYGVSCQAHDLGYDLLRYADRKGQPLGADLREALDDRLSTDMHAACDINPRNSASTCHVVASIYSAGLVVNSWHQRWGPPTGEPIAPMVAGVGVIGLLLSFRLRNWVRTKHVFSAVQHKKREQPSTLSSWVMLGISSLIITVAGTAALALARWAGADDGWIWPITWLLQLSALFFFAGSHAGLVGWRTELASGNGYRQFLAHRASWVLRPTLIFVVVALVMPMALELLGSPTGTNTVAMHVALYPLWLVGIYLVLTALTPVTLMLQRKAHLATLLVLGTCLALAASTPPWLPDTVWRYVGMGALALLVQQCAFWYFREKPSQRWLIAGVVVGVAGAVLFAFISNNSLVIGAVGNTPVAAQANPLLMFFLGLVQLSLLGLFAKQLMRLSAKRLCGKIVHTVLRLPMSLYLGFLATMVLLIGGVYFRGEFVDFLGWIIQPRPILALVLLVAPAILVFWWFERRRPLHYPPHPAPRFSRRADIVLSRTAVVLGLGFSAIGLFGFALTQFKNDPGFTLLGMDRDPIQNFIQLLLGVFLLHTVRTGQTTLVSTWLVVLIASTSPLFSELMSSRADVVTIATHGATSAIAISALATILVRPRMVESPLSARR